MAAIARPADRGDFNWDAHPDIAWQNDITRQVCVWFMNGSTMTGFAHPAPGVYPGWRLAAVADMDNNGVPDLVWQNETTRSVGTWYMAGAQGTTLLRIVYQAPDSYPGWRLVGVADFDNNGVMDFAWQHDDTRQMGVWYMAGPDSSVQLFVDWPAPGTYPGWRVVGLADMDNNGVPDIVWQEDTTRSVGTWYMSGPRGTNLLEIQYQQPNSYPGWTIAGVADYDGNGVQDLIWQNDATRVLGIWYMGAAKAMTKLSENMQLAAPEPGWRAVMPRVTAWTSTPQQQYHLTTSVNSAGAGTINPASGWYNNGTVVTVAATPNSGYQFAGFTGALSGMTNPQSLTMNAAKSVTANFIANASYTALTIDDWRNCITNMTQVSTCVLKERAEPHEVNAPIEINRSVVVRGGTAAMNDTKLVRGRYFTGDLIRIGSAGSPAAAGVALRYLTVCGGSNITPNWAPSPLSPVGCPRLQTVCGDRTADVTRNPGQPPIGLCVDVNVVHSALMARPNDPFNSPPAAYAVELDHVDLEDATGHALNLSAGSGRRVDDVYFHDGAINYSAVTAILVRVDGANYTRKFCDGLPGFANDTSVYAPRNIRVENNQFIENRTGVTGGIARWFAFRNNTFTRNYIWPQAQGCAVPGTSPPLGDPNLCWGGTLEFDVCADQIHVVNNVFTGPGPAHRNTQALEMYGRNIVVEGNSISGYEIQGIVAMSVDGGAIRNNSISYAAPSDPREGGITVSTVGAGGACTQSPLEIYRESKDITISGNSILGQHYGVHLAEHPFRSSGAIHNLTVGANFGNWLTAQYLQDAFVWPAGYVGPPNFTLGQQQPFVGVTPRVLPVDAESTASHALCATPGAARASFTFAASDDTNGSSNLPGYEPRLDYGSPGYTGAKQIEYIEGIFRNTAPPNWQQSTIGECRFFYASDVNMVYLDDGTGTWGGGTLSSLIGTGGRDLSHPNAGCIIHAATSIGASATGIPPGQYARSVTLDIEFLSSGRKYIYVYTRNKNGMYSYAPNDGLSQPIWQHWGWWERP